MQTLEMQKNVSVQVDSNSEFALLLPGGVYEIKKMEPRSRLRGIVFVCLFLAISGIVGFGYFCPDQVCALTKRDMLSTSQSDVDFLRAFQDNRMRHSPHSGSTGVAGHAAANPGMSYEEVLNDDFQFDINAHDVMVFLHIQKTGGTSFGRHLVRDLDLRRPCTCQRNKKRCYCFRPNRNENWLFSRYSTGWKCGLHADWTELTGCVDSELDRSEGGTAKRRYFYLTLLRDPVARYLSEFRHVQRGATWKNSRHWCNGRTATTSELPPCFPGNTWHGVQFDEFAGCTSNLASNRQTRMLADLALIGCYNSSYLPKNAHDQIMLASAKRNLASMAYFGLTEYQKVAQYVFEETFNLRFAIPFDQHNATVSAATLNGLTLAQAQRVRDLNALDVELYAFAKQLMFARFQRLKVRDPHFQTRFQHLGELGHRNGITEFDWDTNVEDASYGPSQR